MTLPEHGDLGWDTPLNNAVQAISADAAAAKADALAARNDAAYAKQAVDTVGIDDLASALSDAETAADTATTNASVATGAASSAQSYATQASTARSAAEDARDAAEAARTDLLSQKGAASGVAPLDSGSRVPQGNLPAHLDPTALTASMAQLTAWAKDPDNLVAGALTYSGGLLASAAVVWPDGATGTLTITSRQSGTDAITGYTITRVVSGQPAKTYTQPTITRDSSGNATTVPQITVA